MEIITIGGKNTNKPINSKTYGECSATVGKDSAVCSSKKAISIMRDWLEKNGGGSFEYVKNDEKVIEKMKQKTDCGSESCIYTKLRDVLPASELDERFAPKGPYNNTAWLSNDDIDSVLESYTKLFPGFLHIPYQMSDFPSYGGELVKLDIVEAAKNNKYMACVLNTDVHSGSGQHWVCLFCDFQNATIEYFDSVGRDPFDSIHDYMISSTDILNSAKINQVRFKYVIVCNDIVHQVGDTECGVYSLYYIINRLNGVPYKYFEQNAIPDEMMIRFRKYLFRHS